MHAEAARGREREIETEIACLVRAAEGAGLAAVAHVGLHALSYLHWRDAEQHRWAECDCLTHLALLDLETGRPQRALARCAELMPVAQKMGEGSEAPFAADLEAVARYALREPGAGAALGAALAELRRIDSNLLVACTLNLAAEADLLAGDTAAAKRRAGDALQAARRVGGRNMTVFAHALLARAAQAEGRAGDAVPHLTALKQELASDIDLTARARAAAAAALDARIPTPVPTPPSPLAS